MFGFGKSHEGTPKGDLFNLDEIRHLVQEFPLDGVAPSENGLLALASETGFTTKDAIIKAYSELMKGKRERVPIATLEKELDVTHDVLLSIIRSRQDFILSQSKEDVVPRSEQESILELLFQQTKTKFIHATTFAEEVGIDIQGIQKLLTLSEEIGDNPLQMLDAPGQSRSKSLELGNSYVHQMSTLLELRSDVIEKCKNAHTAARVATWNHSEMYGLDIPSFARLAQQLVQEFNGPTELYGFFERRTNEVRYVTKNYLLRKAKRTLKEVAMGDEAFCDLEKLVKTYPTLLPDIEAAKQLATTECLHKDGSKYKWHFISHYAIGDAGLNNTAKKCLELLAPPRYLNTKVFVQGFPSEIQREVLILLQNQTVEFWRYCGGELAEILGLDEWLILKTVLSDVEYAAKRLGRSCADDSWAQEKADLVLTEKSGRDALLEKLHEESDMPMELLSRLWDDERVHIQSEATSSFMERSAELKAESRSQLEALWKSRLWIPARIHEHALEELEEGPLKDQLQDLLSVYLAQDLVPSTLKRMRAKGLLRDPQLQKQVNKLEGAVALPKKDSSIIRSLERFHEKMEFAALGPDQFAQARSQQLADMVKVMEADTDGPRLFLSMVIILLSSQVEVGIVYATGKFAPRLLKLLKPALDEALFEKLERLKDTVKTGTVADEDRVEMRSIAVAALEVR